MHIRTFHSAEREAVIALWQRCGQPALEHYYRDMGFADSEAVTSASA